MDILLRRLQGTSGCMPRRRGGGAFFFLTAAGSGAGTGPDTK